MSDDAPRPPDGWVTVPLPPISQPEFPEYPDWWPDGPGDEDSPWSVTIFDGKPRLDFDGGNEEENFRLKTGLQVSDDGEFHPFILLSPERAELLASHLLAAVNHVRKGKS